MDPDHRRDTPAGGGEYNYAGAVILHSASVKRIFFCVRRLLPPLSRTRTNTPETAIPISPAK